MCLPLSSAYALLDDYDIEDGEVQVAFDTYYDAPDNVLIKNSGWKNVTTTNLTYTTAISYSTVATTDFITSYSIRNDTEALFAQNETAVLTFDGLTQALLVYNNSTGSSGFWPFDSAGVNLIQVYARSSDSNYSELLEDAKVDLRTYSDGTFSLSLNSGVLPFTVSGFSVHIYYGIDAFDDFPPDVYAGGYPWTFELKQGWTDHKLNYSYLPASSSITSEIRETVTEVKEEIVALPDKIGDVITGLFVPSEDDVTSQQDKWTELLSDRFGALYQVGDLVTDYANAFVESEQDIIHIPTIEIPFGEVVFQFGGWDVQVIPDGFQVVIEALKLIVSIACTFLFVNGLKRRFEGLIGGAPTA